MAFDAHKNFPISAVATAPSPAASGTSLVVTGGHGTRFPAVPFNAIVCAANAVPDPTNSEIVRVTNIATDTFTITRATETGAGGPSARTILVGDRIFAAVTAKSLTDIEAGTNFPLLTSAGLVDLSGAAAGQIKFPAAQNASADANTLDDYEEGTWTPADGSGAGLVFTSVTGRYTKIGRKVVAAWTLKYPSTADGSNATISGLPFTSGADAAAIAGFVTVATPIYLWVTGTTIVPIAQAGGTNIANSTCSLKLLYGVAVYSV